MNPHASFDTLTLDYNDPVFMHSYSEPSIGTYQKAAFRAGAPSSGTLLAVHRVSYIPIRVAKPYPISRFFWDNGATAGTDGVGAVLYDKDFKWVAASKRVLSAGTNAVQFATQGINAGALTEGNSSTDATNYTTASVTMLPGRLYILSFVNTAANAAAASSITGGGGLPTFTSRGSLQYNGTAHRVSFFTAVPTAAYTGTVTINFGATQTGIAFSITEYRNVDTATNDGIVQTATGTGTSTTPSATLGAFASADNGTLMVAGAANSSGWTDVQPWTVVANESPSTPTGALGSAYRADNDTTTDGATITSAAWGCIGAELKGLTTFPVIMPGNYYIGLHCSGTTATFFRRSTFTTEMGVYIQNLNGSQGDVPVLTPTANGGTLGHIPVVGFTRRASP